MAGATGADGGAGDSSRSSPPAAGGGASPPASCGKAVPAPPSPVFVAGAGGAAAASGAGTRSLDGAGRGTGGAAGCGAAVATVRAASSPFLETGPGGIKTTAASAAPDAAAPRMKTAARHGGTSRRLAPGAAAGSAASGFASSAAGGQPSLPALQRRSRFRLEPRGKDLAEFREPVGGQDHSHDGRIAPEDGREPPRVERAPEAVGGVGPRRGDEVHQSHADFRVEQGEGDGRAAAAQRAIPEHEPARAGRDAGDRGVAPSARIGDQRTGGRHVHALPAPCFRKRCG